jgi:hypothetical protein
MTVPAMDLAAMTMTKVLLRCRTAKLWSWL